jgi:predicted TIM-barrel fold metal-dependent hydrolase
MIIDSHCHWLPKEVIENAHFYSKSWGDIEAQVRMMDAAGIDKAVLSYPTSDAHLKLGSLQKLCRLYNDAVAAVLKMYPKRFIGAAVLPVEKEEEMLLELSYATGDLGCMAISLASSYDGVYLDDKRFFPLYEKAQKERIPIFVHAQIVNPIGYERLKDPLLTPVFEYVFDLSVSIGRLLMADVFLNFPEVKFVFGYFGGVVPFLKHRFDATYDMLRGINFVKDLKAQPTAYLKNIYVDTSGDTVETNLKAALELVGPQHVLWGSDWPAKKDPELSMRAIREFCVSQETREDILGRNAERVLSQV